MGKGMEVHSIYTGFTRFSGLRVTSLMEFKQVKLSGSYSCIGSVPLGEPLGSILGPLLFSILINVAEKFFNFELFSDDMKIYRAVASTNDISHFQKDFDNLHKWCESNKRLLNVLKCYAINLKILVLKFFLLTQFINSINCLCQLNHS